MFMCAPLLAISEMVYVAIFSTCMIYFITPIVSTTRLVATSSCCCFVFVVVVVFGGGGGRGGGSLSFFLFFSSCLRSALDLEPAMRYLGGRNYELSL